MMEALRGRPQERESNASLSTHLALERRPPPPLEEMLDSEAQRRRGSSRRGAAETSSSTVKPLATPGEKRKWRS